MWGQVTTVGYVNGAEGGTRTPTPEGTAPSRQRVYQFHHSRKKMFGLHMPLTGAGPKTVPRRHHRFREWERRKVPEPP